MANDSTNNLENRKIKDKSDMKKHQRYSLMELVLATTKVIHTHYCSILGTLYAVRFIG